MTWLKEFGDMLDGKGSIPWSTYAARTFAGIILVWMFAVAVLLTYDLGRDVFGGRDPIPTEGRSQAR